MPWSEHIHIHIHNDETNHLLREILDQLKVCCPASADDDVIPQATIDKLDAIIADIKSTIP